MAKAKPNTTARKRTTPPATVAASSSTAASAKPATGSPAAKAAAPSHPLYVVGTMPPVRPGTHRAYAQLVAKQCLAAAPKGFTLVAYRAALVASVAASSIAPPTGGWQAHNMPTWAANPAQAWLVLA